MPGNISLTELFLARDESALKEAEKEYGAYLRTVVSRFLDDPRDVEECVNDTLLSVWHSVPPNRPEKIELYAAAIARHKAIDRLQKQKNSAAGRICVPVGELGDVVSETEDPYYALRYGELVDAITEFALGLSKSQKAIFMARYFDYYTVKEISERLGVSANTIYVQLTRLRKKLKKYLMERGFLP